METSLLEMPPWQIFLLMGIALAVLEIFVPGFILLPIGVGFALTAPVTLLTDSLPVQLVALAGLEGVVFFLARRYGPIAQRPTVYSGTEGMIGQECEVTEEISASRPGYVRLYGDRWQAKTHSLMPLLVGTRARITRFEGNKVYVEPLNAAGGIE